MPYYLGGMDSNKMAIKVEKIPKSIKTIGKFVLAFPFMYHNINGIRHLVWDTARSLSIKSIYSSGYVIVGLSALSSLAIASK